MVWTQVSPIFTGCLMQKAVRSVRKILTAKKEKEAMATKGNRRIGGAGFGKGMETESFRRDKSTYHIYGCRNRRSRLIQHIWMTPTGVWRNSIIRFYWDDEKTPSVEAPVGDFFGMGWGQYASTPFTGCLRESRICISIVTGPCLSGKNAGSPWKILITNP